MTTDSGIEIDQIAVSPGKSVLLSDISWQKFESILARLGENRASKLFYDQGKLEIMVPLPEHEYFKETIGDLIKDLADFLSMEYESLGSTTWRKQKSLGGAEPDNCFYFQNAPAIRGRQKEIDLEQDPPPDLVLEVDITSKSLDSLPIYARLGIPEVWRYDQNRLRIYQLIRAEQTYIQTECSLAFPNVPVQAIPEFINENQNIGGRGALRKAWREYVIVAAHEN